MGRGFGEEDYKDIEARKRLGWNKKVSQGSVWEGVERVEDDRVEGVVVRVVGLMDGLAELVGGR